MISGRPGCWETNESMTRSRTRQPVKPDPSSSAAAPVSVLQLPAAPEPSSRVESVCQPGLPDGALRQQLQALFDSEAAASCVHASARMAHTVRAVDVLQPALSIVLEGCKTVHCADCDGQLLSGAMLVMCAGARLDVQHQPDVQTGRYRALMVPLCDEVLTAARLLLGTGFLPATAASAPTVSGSTGQVVTHGIFTTVPPADPISSPGPWICTAIADDHAPALLRWAHTLLQGDHAGARAALAALVIALVQQRGLRRLVLPQAPTLAHQVREQVQAAPARHWQSRDFEALLGLSGATLRRRLAAEHTSLRELLAEVRLGLSLNLLYGTHLPLKTVAARVGYRSPDAFVRAFRMRFGLEPSQLGREAD